MRKVFLKIIIIAVFMYALIPICKVHAAEAGLSASGTTVGGTVNATLSMPEGAVGYQATATITYSDGSTESKKLAGVNQNMDQVDDDNFAFAQASSEGTATISITGLLIYDGSGSKLNSNSSISTSVNIEAIPEPDPEPEPDPDPEPNSEPESTPDNNDKKTPEPEPTFQDVNDTVYVKSRVNVRESYSTSSAIYTLLEVGTEVTRTGIGDNGWTRVKYNGKTAYISSSFLSTEPVDKEETKDEEDKAKKEEIEKIQKSLGTLPEVGNNIAVYVYSIIAGISTVGAVVIKFCTRS